MPGFRPKAAPAKASGKAAPPAGGHVPSARPGGCGTGKGGFQPGNTCGHRSNRNATVEAKRQAHQAAKAEVSRHLKAHKAATRKAVRAGESAPHPKELHAALKKAARAHQDFQAARAAHQEGKRAERNKAARDRRAAGKAVASGTAQPAHAGLGSSQARPARTDRPSPNDRLAVAAARHQSIARRLHARSHELRQQAAREAPGGTHSATSHAISGSRGRGLGGAAVGRVNIGTPASRAMEAASDKLFERARAHGERSRALEKRAIAGKIEEAKARVRARRAAEAEKADRAPEFKPAKTIDEANDYLKSKGIEPNWHAEGYQDHDYRMNLDHINEVHSALNPLVARYPEATPKSLGTMYASDLNKWNRNFKRNIEEDRLEFQAKGKRWRESQAEVRVTRKMVDKPTPDKSDTYEKYNIFHGGTYTPDERAIRLNHRNVVIQSREKSEESRQQSLSKGRNLDGVGFSYGEIAQHEMGHSIDYTFGIHKHPEMIALHSSLTPEQIHHGLSDYAKTNIKEFIAEGFTEGLRHDARPLGRRVKSLIDKLVSEHRSNAR